MASMERNEVLGRLVKLATKAERKGKTRRRLALIMLRKAYMDTEYGDCNTCYNSTDCRIAPIWGDAVRVNCYCYRGPEKVSKKRD